MARSKKDPLKNALSFEKEVVQLDHELKDLEGQLAELEAKLSDAGDEPDEDQVAKRDELAAKRDEVASQRDEKLDELADGLTMWQRIQLSRHVERPVTADYVERLLDDVIELHGDRTFGDDKAIYCGLGRLGERRILLVAHRKGVTTEERIACNWGCAHPEGYRKALRCMQLAARLGLPIVTLINTPGAYPGIGAEERGQASAIAWNILEMSVLPVPIVSVVIGEGGSGGALGIGVCDRLMVLENAYYSVISPEGCASILWKDGARAEEAAHALRLSTGDLGELGVADEILPEPKGGAHRDKDAAASSLGAAVTTALDELCNQPVGELLEARRAKYRHIGSFRGGEPVGSLKSLGSGPSASQDAS